MNKDAPRVRQRVIEAWDNAIYRLTQMYQASQIKPSSGYEVFRIDSATSDDEVKLNFGPVVFHVPERPDRRGPNLFVVAKGWLTLDGPDFKTTPLRTKTFGTEVAYFRLKAGHLEHVYGAHYDMDEKKPGHPVFHAQFGSQQAFSNDVRDLFNRNDNVVDHMAGILKTVRTPSAQMDIFAVLSQICADHLMTSESSSEVKQAFTVLRSNCDFLVGAAHRLGFLNGDHAASCYRASHWYEAPTANA